MEEIGESGTFTLSTGRRISGAADEKAIDPDDDDTLLDLLSLTARLSIHTWRKWRSPFGYPRNSKSV